MHARDKVHEKANLRIIDNLSDANEEQINTQLGRTLNGYTDIAHEQS